jgi:hypothetical protein
MEHAIWSNVLYTDVIHGKDGRREVIMNITDYRSKNDNAPDNKVVLSILADMYKSRKAIANAICNHNWVLNSRTETTCSMGCTHDNLNTKSKTKKAPKELLNVPAMINSFYQPISVLLEQCRIMVNITKSSFDNYTEEQNQQLKYLVGEAIKKYSVGDNILPKYRVRLNYEYRDPRNKVVTFENDAAMEAFVFGLVIQRPYSRTEEVYNQETGRYENKTVGLSITTEVFSLETNRYEEFQLHLATTCIYCKKEVDLTGDTVNGNSHVECHVKHVARSKVKEHWLDVMTHKTIDKRMDEYGHDYIKRNLLEYVSDIFYGNFEITSAEMTDRYAYDRKTRQGQRVIRLKIKSSWYQDQDIKNACIKSWMPEASGK